MAKKSPTGFKAQCQCGLIIGALDYTQTDRKESGRIMGQWLHDGCMIIPQFDSSWQTTVNICRCDAAPRKHDPHGDAHLYQGNEC